MRSDVRSRIVILSAALLAATAMPAWAKWDEVGHVDVHRQGERFTRDIPLGGPVDRLQLTATGGDVLCRHVRATFGNGRSREVFHGTLREHRAQLKRAITDQTQRLACYDGAVAALDQAEQAHNIVVMDKSQVREARRSLFGFSLPKIHLFGSGDDEEVTKIDAVVASTTRDQDNRMIFTIDGGARWHQIDDRTVVGVKRGVKVTIKEAAFGSYFADFPHGAMRVRREN